MNDLLYPGKHGITLYRAIDVMTINMVAAGNHNSIGAHLECSEDVAGIYHPAAHYFQDTDVVGVMNATRSS